MSSSTKPIILVVQGAFQTSDFYQQFEENLGKHDYEVVHPILPSCSNPTDPSFPTKTISDDARAVKSHVDRLVEQEKEIVVFVHSYGGLVASEAITEDVSLDYRKARNLKGGVRRLVFCAAFALHKGSSILGTFGISPHNDVQSDGRNFFKDGEYKLFSDLDPDGRRTWARKTIPHPYIVQEYEMTNCAWQYVPSSYIVLDNDECVPPAAQEMMATMIGAEVEHLAAGHEPMLSRPEDLGAKVILLINTA